MLYNRLYLHFFLFLSVFFVQKNLVTAATQQISPEQLGTQVPVEGSSSAEATDAVTKIFQGMRMGPENLDLDAILDVLKKIQERTIQAEIARENAQREAHFRLLPERVGQAVRAANSAYQDLAELLHIENAFGVLCCDLERDVGRATFEKQSDQQAILDDLSYLSIVLKNGLFKKVSLPEQLPGGQQAQLLKGIKALTGAGQEEQDFGRADIVSFLKKINILIARFEGLSEAIAKVPSGEHRVVHNVLHEKAAKLVIILKAAQQRDSKTLTRECVELLEQKFAIVLTELSEAISTLGDARIQLACDADQKLKDALDYWRKSLREYRKTITSFLTLKSMASIDLSSILHSFSQIYDISSIFLRANTFQSISMLRDPFGVRANPVDTALRAALVGAVCIQTTGDHANQGVQEYLLGTTPLAKFANPLNEWQYLVAMMSGGLQAAHNPTMFSARMHPITRAMCRIVGACFWHGVFESQLIFESNSGKPLNTDYGLKIAVVATIKEAQDFLDGYLEDTLRDNVDPIILEDVEQLSMGLIKPDLINLALEIVVPMIFLKKNTKIQESLNFQDGDFLSYDVSFCRRLTTYLHKDGLKRADLAGLNQLHAEYLLINYACSNLGRFWGAEITRQLQIPLLGIAAKTANAIGTGIFNLVDFFISDNTDDRAADSLSPIDFLMSKDGQFLLKHEISSLFQEESDMRDWVIQSLKAYGLLKANVYDPLEINYRLVVLLLHYLTAANIFSHSMNADMLDLYVDYQRNIGPFIDILIEKIVENLSAALGGLAGSELAKYFVADRLVWEWRAPDLIKNNAPA